MSLRLAVAAPFQRAGTDTMAESEFVVALSLDRDWFSPDQAKRLVDVAASEGLLTRTDDGLRVAFDAASTDVPEDFRPGEDVLRQRSVFEKVLDALVDAGVAKQEAVANVNSLQSELGVTVEAAAVLYAHRQGIDVQDHASTALGEL
ncbi:DUF2240 family protein [Natronomonas sp. EA1]|uniref:DUF2240 family protein n=1 Tax=Natronomonas sp. EA1 TaxID=3421655 RepID=UPI003EC0DA53